MQESPPTSHKTHSNKAWYRIWRLGARIVKKHNTKRGESFASVFLFGYSQHFQELIEVCENISIKTYIVYGARQEAEVSKLRTGKMTKKVKAKNLQDKTYIEAIEKEQNKLGISIGAPFIFKDEDIKEFNGNLINSHGAPLPSFKGGGGFSWRIMQKDKRGTILVHLISEGMTKVKLYLDMTLSLMSGCVDQ